MAKESIGTEFGYSGHRFKVSSPPFNPSSVAFDDLLKASEGTHVLLVAYELGSYASFMNDFATWLSKATERSGVQIIVLGNRPADSTVKNVVEVRSYRIFIVFIFLITIFLTLGFELGDWAQRQVV